MPDNTRGVDEKSIAFERTFREQYAAVYRYVMRRVEEPAVQDLVAETFLIAWRRQGELSGHPLPWLLGVARRVCANHLRARGRRAALGERVAAQRQPDTGPRLEDRGLKQALASLSDRDREAVMLIGWDGLTNREAAQVLGCSAATFAVRLHRARARLATALDSEHDCPADTPETGGMATSDAH
jgi:RNA polymerase sigma-70 factor (ECF subfamily)